MARKGPGWSGFICRSYWRLCLMTHRYILDMLGPFLDPPCSQSVIIVEKVEICYLLCENSSVIDMNEFTASEGSI